MARKYANLLERLLAHSGKVEPTGCWMWHGHIDKGGYGRMTIRIKGKPVGCRVHKVAYELVNGPVPAGYSLDHKDDVCLGGACWNLDHLEAVPCGVNSARMRKRIVGGYRKAYKVAA